MPLEIVPIDGPAGAEILGADVGADLDQRTFAAIEAALYRYGVIVIRDQSISPHAQVAFTERFGQADHNFNANRYGIEGSTKVYRISNIRENGEPIGTARAGTTWHTDMSYAAEPAKATMLYAVEVPMLHGLSLGDTSFANAAAAFDALPQAMRSHIEGLQGVFDFRGRKRTDPPSPADIARYPPVHHPIVRTHPVTGRKGLYVVRDDCTGIVGMDPAEATALIEALADHIVRPDFVYRHRWQVGDIVMWDNASMQHRATVDYDLPQRRLMWRTTVKGERPR